MVNWIKGLFKKKKPGKIRMTIKDDKLIKVNIPSSVYEKHHELAVRQEIECYRIKINGNYLQLGLGGIGGALSRGLL
jgi:acyl-CoA hydrolase